MNQIGKYSEDELIRYAKGQIGYFTMQKGRRLVLGYTAVATLLTPLLGLACIRDKLGLANYGFLLDKEFAAGVLGGTMFSGWLLVCVVGTMRTFRLLDGKEIEVYRLLVEMAEKKNQGWQMRVAAPVR